MKKTKITLWLFTLCSLIFAGCGSAELEEENSDLKKELKTLKKDKDDLETQLETLTADKDAAQAELATKQAEVDDIQRKLTGQESDLEFFTNQNAELEQQMGTIREELVAAKNRVLELEQGGASAIAAVSPVGTVPPPVPGIPPAPPAPPLGVDLGIPPAPPATPGFATTPPVPGIPTSPVPPAPPVIPSTPAAPPPPPPPSVPEGVDPGNSLLGLNSNLVVNLYLVSQGRQIPLKDTTIYVTEEKPNVAQWGFHLKSPSISANALQTIEQSLTTSIIHKKEKTDENGMVNLILKEGTYWVSCASPATSNGLQWSVQQQIVSGQNNLTLSNGNILR